MGMFRAMVLAGAIAVFMSGEARAADLGSDPPSDWTGFYVGAYGGVTWADGKVDDNLYTVPGPNDAELPFPVVDFVNGQDDFSPSSTGGTFGVQAGYDIQRDRLVFGIQADFGGLDLDGSEEASGVVALLFDPGT